MTTVAHHITYVTSGTLFTYIHSLTLHKLKTNYLSLLVINGNWVWLEKDQSLAVLAGNCPKVALKISSGFTFTDVHTQCCVISLLACNSITSSSTWRYVRLLPLPIIITRFKCKHIYISKWTVGWICSLVLCKQTILKEIIHDNGTWEEVFYQNTPEEHMLDRKGLHALWSSEQVESTCM